MEQNFKIAVPDGCTASIKKQNGYLDALAKESKRWNAEEKRIEDLPRWRAEKGKEYFYILFDGRVEKDADIDYMSDIRCYNAGNYFRTREAAEKVAEQIREILKNSKAE